MQARCRAGAAVLGLHAPQSCSSAPALKRVDSKALSDPLCRHPNRSEVGRRHTLDVPPSLDSLRESGRRAAPRASAARAGSESRITLPPLAANGRGSAPSQENPKPDRRSRSRIGAQPSVADDRLTLLQSVQHGLGTSLSSDSAVCHEEQDSRFGTEVEDVLVTALALSGEPSERKASKELRSSKEIEAHLAKLEDLCDDGDKCSHRTEKCCTRRRKSKGRRASIDDPHGDNENKLLRKGTGFVHLSSSGDEPSKLRARIADEHGDNENGLLRKGTGFVFPSVSREKCADRRPRILDDHGDNENQIRRKGTGFVHLSSLPQDSPSVWFPEMTGGNVNRIQRKGTGFVVLSHLSPRVRIADPHGDNENKLQRKGTGFVNLSDCDTDCELLPSTPSSCSDGEAEDDVCGDRPDTDQVRPPEQQELLRLTSSGLAVV